MYILEVQLSKPSTLSKLTSMLKRITGESIIMLGTMALMGAATKLAKVRTHPNFLHESSVVVTQH